MNWYVAIIPPQRERQVMADMMAHGIEVYIAMETRWGPWKANGKRDPVSRPIIPGYAFLRFTPDQQPAAEGCVSSFLRVGRNLAQIQATHHDREGKLVVGWIEETRSKELAGDFDRTIDRTPKVRMLKGEAVRIVAGKFQGWLGVITETGKKPKLDMVGPRGELGKGNIPAQHLAPRDAA